MKRKNIFSKFKEFTHSIDSSLSKKGNIPYPRTRMEIHNHPATLHT